MTEVPSWVKPELVDQLRDAARRRAPVADLIRLIQAHVKHANSITVMKYFMRAFDLEFTDVRSVEGSSLFGNSLYNEDELEEEFQPMIQKAIKAIDSK